MASNPLAEKRGPKIGDAASLWNFTPSPGWTKEEVHILRLCLLKHGIGRWIQILEEGLLPGKLIQQLNGQTQRLLGQQSLVAYSGLQVDVDRIRTDNEARTDVERKAGLIINTGPNLTKQMKEKLKEEARAKYGLAPEQIKEVEEKIEEVRASLKLGDSGTSGSGASGSGTAGREPAVSLMNAAPSSLSKEQKVALLRRLHSALQSAHAQLQKAIEAGAQQQEGQPPAAAAKQGAPRPTNSNAENEPAAANTDSMEVDLPSSGADVGAQQPQPLQQPGAAAAVSAKPGKAGGAKRKAGGTGGNGRKSRAPKSGAGSDGEWEPETSGQRGGKSRGRRQSSADVDVHDSKANGSVEAANLQQLQDMGFPAKQAALALEECGGDLEAALEWLAENCL